MPAINLSFQNLWKSLPQINNVSYTSVSNNGNANYVIPAVVTTPINRGEAHPSQGIYRKMKTTYKIDPILWHTVVGPDIYPKVKDIITVDNIPWTVWKDVDGSHLQSLYRLACVYLQLNPVLEQMIVITAPKDQIDTFLSPITAQGVQENGVPAAMIQTSAELVTFMGKKGFRRWFDIFTYLEEDFEYGTLITDSNLNKYIVEKVEMKTRLDELMKITAYINP